MVSGCKIEFDFDENVDDLQGHMPSYFVKECKELDDVIEEFLSLKVVKKVPWEQKGFVSPIFAIPQKDGSV